MAGPASEVRGGLRRPTKPTPPNKAGESRVVTRGMNGVCKRKRPEIEISDREVSESESIECLEINNKPATSLDEFALLVAALKDVIEQQNSIIKNIKNDFAEVKKQNEQQNNTIENIQRDLVEVKSQNGRLQSELKHAHEKLDSISKCPALSASSGTSPNPSYADVARTPPNSSPANLNSLSSAGTTLSGVSNTLYCTIDTSRAVDEDADKTSVGAIRIAVEKELQTTKGQSNWRCRAVTKDAKNTKRIRITCRDETEQQLVKQAVETKIAPDAPGVRVMRDELHPIKVDNVNRLAVLDDNGEIRAGAAEALSQENDAKIAKIGWLSKKGIPKAYGSMVVYITKESDARRLLAEGFFHAGGESGYTGVFERRTRPEQCYKCQEVGHKAFQCKNPQRCARCAKEGHRHDSCSEVILKCIPCGGPHESFSRNCPRLYPTRHE